MSKVNRTSTPFLIFTGHRPNCIDSSDASPHGGNLTTAIELQKAVEPLLVKYRVDSRFLGHEHSEQHNCIVIGGECWLIRW
jgi:hypothetical protein